MNCVRTSIAAVTAAVSMICVASSAAHARAMHLPCASANFKARLVVKPRSCSTLTVHRSIAESATVDRLRWRTWGSPVAVATGYLRPQKTYDRPVRITVTASGVAYTAKGDRYYDKLSIRSPRGLFAFWVAPESEYRENADEFERAAVVAVEQHLGEDVTVSAPTLCDIGQPGRWRCRTGLQWTQPDGGLGTQCYGQLLGYLPKSAPPVVLPWACQDTPPDVEGE